MSMDLTDEKLTLDWFAIIRQQVITWANVDPNMCCHMALLADNELSGYLKQKWPMQLKKPQGCQQQGCQPVRNFRILYGFYMQNTGVRIWPRKYGNWALSVLSLKVLLPEQSLPVLGSKSVRICGILCLRTSKYLFNHQNIQSSLFHM